MTRWAAFAGVATAVTLLLLALARASATAVSGTPVTRTDVEWLDPLPDGADHLDVDERPPPPSGGMPELSTAALFVNVAFSQGLFAIILVAGAWYAAVPASAFGVSQAMLGVDDLAIGIAFGAALAVINTLAGYAAQRFGHAPSEQLRELLAPASTTGWIGLLGVVLPLVALFEELLFRGALVGALSSGFAVSPWVLAVVSSVAFALGHGAQGRAGIAVTGALGFVLATGYLLTGSLLVVVIAHYLVNAAEFVVFEGFGVELAWKS